jgi:hypothetical protein
VLANSLSLVFFCGRLPCLPIIGEFYENFVSVILPHFLV